MQETQETQVQSLSREDSLGKEMATQLIILAWKISWTQEPGGLESMGLQNQTQLDTIEWLRTHKGKSRLKTGGRNGSEPTVHMYWNKAYSATQLCLTLCDPPGFLPEKAMAPHSSTLAWEIPWMEEPGRLQSMGSLRVGYNWVTSRSLFTFMNWWGKWQPTPMFLPGESQGWGSLLGCRPWGRTELDTTEVT